MLRYLAGRVLQALLTLLAIALITFLLMHAVPGGPFAWAKRDGPL